LTTHLKSGIIVAHFRARRGVREAYGAALEKRSPCLRSVGSNPTLSAVIRVGGLVKVATIQKIWEDLLGKESLAIAPEEVKEIIDTLFIPDKIHPETFIANYKALSHDFSATEILLGIEKKNQPTPSLSHFTHVANRPPAFPLWFIAAYPDVLLWFDNKGKEYIETHGRDYDGQGMLLLNLLGIDPTTPNLEESDILDGEGKSRPNILKNLVKSYKDATGKELETAVSKPEDDIYRGAELLEALGAESNFTLIASNITKYYLELTRNYSKRFSGEVSLLAAAGLLDAQFYVLIEGVISLSEILDMAKKSALLGDEALIDFIINLEARIFEIDSPDVDISDIEMACFGQKESIAEVTQRTKKEYISEPHFASETAALMNSPQFKPFRQMLGVSD
jgi:hypothetical protein